MKAYVFLADGFEEVEAVATIDVLRRAGIDTVSAAVMGSREVTGSHGIIVAADRVYAANDAEGLCTECDDGDIVILPGGLKGSNNLGDNEGIVKLLKHYLDSGRKIAAICAAPGVLGLNGLLVGHKAVCYPGHEHKLLGAELMDAPAVTDGSIITGRSMGTAVDFGLAIVSALLGSEKAAEINETLKR